MVTSPCVKMMATAGVNCEQRSTTVQTKIDYDDARESGHSPAKGLHRAAAARGP